MTTHELIQEIEKRKDDFMTPSDYAKKSGMSRQNVLHHVNKKHFDTIVVEDWNLYVIDVKQADDYFEEQERLKNIRRKEKINNLLKMAKEEGINIPKEEIEKVRKNFK